MPLLGEGGGRGRSDFEIKTQIFGSIFSGRSTSLINNP